MEKLTKALMTDETGQAIVSKLTALSVQMHELAMATRGSAILFESESDISVLGDGGYLAVYVGSTNPLVISGWTGDNSLVTGHLYYLIKSGTAVTSSDLGEYGGTAVTSTTFTEHGVPADDFAVGQALAEKADSDDVTALDTRVTAVEGDISDLQGLQDVINEYNGYKSDNLHDSTTTGANQGYWNADGTVTSTATSQRVWRRTALIDISDFNQIEYTGIEYPQNDVYALFLEEDGETVTGAFVPAETTETSVVVDIPADTKYVTFSVHRDYYTSLMVYGIRYGTIVTKNELDSVKTDVDALESGTGEIADDVTALDTRVTAVEGTTEGLQDVINEYNGYKSENLHDPTTTSDREGRWNADGTVTSPEKLWRRTALIDVSDFNQIEYTGIEYPQNDAYALFLSADESTVTGAFVPVETMGTSVVVDIPVDTKYVTFTVHRDRCTTLMIYGIKHGTIITRDELDSIKGDVDMLKSGTGEMLKVYEDGYHYINTEWENGSWTGVNEKHGYNYQVRSVSGVVFTEDTLIKADVGFQISGFVLLADGTSQGIGRFSMSWLFPAGSTGYIVVRRRVIDTEERPDPAEFGSKLKIISGRMTEHNAVRDTFYGIEMFESVAICGDSYSEGRANHSWGKCLGRQTGVNVSVFAKSGDNSGEWRVNATKGLPALLAAPACELYWINHGINDSARYHDNPSYLGSVADLTGDYASYPDTFWGNMGCIIESIKAHAPNALLILEKAMWHDPLNSYIETSVTNVPVINQAIEDIGEHYGIPVIDMLDDVFYWSGEWSRGILSNHPDLYMYPGMASANRRLFSRCVRDNYSYFANWLL